ncbi:hypothetical protein GGR56DRAFT_672504 [Xylariaceae sp. FL0804]|nr:hypothetical protein GGR56DRAFT_672504 [Xylariaceae sp. FL0804]
MSPLSSFLSPAAPPAGPRFMFRHMNCDTYTLTPPCPHDDGGPSVRDHIPACLRAEPPLPLAWDDMWEPYVAVGRLAAAHFLRGHPGGCARRHAIRLIDARVVAAGVDAEMEEVERDEGQHGGFTIFYEHLRDLRSRGFVDHVEVRYWTWDEQGILGPEPGYRVRRRGDERIYCAIELVSVLEELNGLARRPKGCWAASWPGRLRM